MEYVQQKSYWSVLALGVLGLVVGYSAVVLSNDTVFARARSCPNQEKVTCMGEGCDTEACKNGECSKNCPGCNRHG